MGSPATDALPDQTTDYAKAVNRGEILAGPHVREACLRHLDDIQHGAARGIVWDHDAAQWVIGFFSHVLRLNGGKYEGKPYDLLPWQTFIVGSIFGWKRADGSRRFRTAYVETSKGSGKSPLAAGIGIYGLVADGEARAEIYAAATKRDQAQILFRDAVAMVDQSPELAARLEKSGAPGREWNLAHLGSGSFFRTLAADQGQSGPRPHIGILDEIHEHRTNHVVEMVRAGTKFRTQPLIFMITNSGFDLTTVCGEYHHYGTKVAARQIQDDSFFAYVCSVDEGDDPLEDESCWPKTNPSLIYGLPGYEYLREQVTQAKGMPAKESVVRRLNFSQWVDAENPLFSPDVWFNAKGEHPDLRGRRCFGGLDLGSTQDLTSLVLAFQPTETDPVWRIKPYFWLPADGLMHRGDRDRVPYVTWRDKGYLETTPGKAVDRAYVLDRIAEIQSQFNLVSIGYDRWRIEDLIQMADAAGHDLRLHPFGQGFKDMSPALDDFERKLLNGDLKHDGNPIMTWNAANAVADTDPAGNRKLTKRKATGRIDGMVAALMAIGASMKAIEQRSVYESRGLRSL